MSAGAVAKGPVAKSPVSVGTVLTLEDFSVDYLGETVVHAVRHVDLTLGRGEILGLAGESGCGKSTLAYGITRLLKPPAVITSGRALFHSREGYDVDLRALHGEDLRAFRWDKISMVFQGAMNSLNPVISIRAQLEDIFTTHRPELSRAERRQRCGDLLERVGVDRDRLRSYPHELSGGMRQRVMIAMAIINDPEIIIADEPTTALDVTVQAQILDTLVRIKDELNAGIIIITHDLGVVAGMVDRIHVMYGGTVVEQGLVNDIFEAQRMPYTVGLLGSIPNPSRLGRRLTPIKGAPPSLMNLPRGCTFAPRCPMAVQACWDAEPLLLQTDQAQHLARCHRSADLATFINPQQLFDRHEIGVVENPAAITVANPNFAVTEELAVVEARLHGQE
jgi:peptide/nickel transport system ATP-binding protein